MSFSENLINIFDTVGKQLGIVIDWSNQNVMPYIEQLSGRIVNYEMVTSIVWLIGIVIACIFSIFLFKLGVKKYRENEFESEKYVPCFIVGAILFVVSLLQGMVEIGDIIACITLPEKTLIEFIMQYK